VKPAASTRAGADQRAPFQRTASPRASTATQKDAVGQETESSTPVLESTYRPVVRHVPVLLVVLAAGSAAPPQSAAFRHKIRKLS
jgi:hypothetical protein